MIDWSVVVPVLRAWVVACTGLGQCVQENEARPFVQSVYARMQIMNVRGAGMDDHGVIEETEIVAGELVTHRYQRISGQRSFTLRLFVESSSQDGPGLADNQLERMRALHVLERMRALLAPANVAVASFGDSQMADVVVDDRVFSAWFVDIDMNAGFAYVDRSVEVGVIEAAEVYAALPRDNDHIEEFAVP